jgi:hypothetical protein
MFNPEQQFDRSSRAAELTTRIEELRKIKIINQSDPSYAAEIEEQIERHQIELNDLTETRH